MIGRFLGLAVAITALAVGVASVASRSTGDGGDAPVTAATQDNSNWTTQRGKRGWSSGVPSSGARSPGGEVRLGRSGDSHFYADTEVDGTNIRMMVDSGASIVAGIEVRRVPAAVIDADMGVSLLGQSFLSKLDAVNVEGDMMTLR